MNMNIKMNMNSTYGGQLMRSWTDSVFFKRLFGLQSGVHGVLIQFQSPWRHSSFYKEKKSLLTNTSITDHRSLRCVVAIGTAMIIIFSESNLVFTPNIFSYWRQLSNNCFEVSMFGKYLRTLIYLFYSCCCCCRRWWCYSLAPQRRNVVCTYARPVKSWA